MPGVVSTGGENEVSDLVSQDWRPLGPVSLIVRVNEALGEDGGQQDNGEEEQLHDTVTAEREARLRPGLEIRQTALTVQSQYRHSHR